MGLFVQCLYALSLHLVSVVFGAAIPTSLNIFGKCSISVVHPKGSLAIAGIISTAIARA